MSKEEENRLWNIVYGNCGYTNYSKNEKDEARDKLLKHYKSENYHN